MKTASAAPGNASACSRNARLTPTASRDCCTAKGIRDVNPLARTFIKDIARLRTGDGRPLPTRLKEEIAREHERLCLVARQLAELEAHSRAELRSPQPASPQARIMQLIDLKSIGSVGGEVLVNEVFYRDFDNRRQVGGYFGLTGTPYDSGQRIREQGISKAGNRRARKLAGELAWLWRRHQPDSELTRWFNTRVGDLKRIQGDAVLPHCHSRPRPRITSHLLSSSRALQGRHCRAELVALKAAAAPSPAVAYGQP
ncbi:transposase [Bradyrhizobium sp. LM2.7]